MLFIKRDFSKRLNYLFKKIYQIYAQQPADYVYKILKKYKADYIILEDSICLSQPKPNFCSLKELLDIDNKHVMKIKFYILFIIF